MTEHLDPIRTVQVISTGTVDIHPQHAYRSRTPVYWWVLTSRRWLTGRPINVFVVEGNDDAWGFVNGKLAMDLGGAGSGHEQRIDFDRLGLTDGQEVELKFFYAHRRETDASRFAMRTNVPLKSFGTNTTVSPLYD